MNRYINILILELRAVVNLFHWDYNSHKKWLQISQNFQALCPPTTQH